MSKKLIHLLRHGSLLRNNDGAIEFWRIKDHLQDHFVFCHHGSDEKWKSAMAGGGGDKKSFQYCVDSSGTILYLRALRGHSGRNLIDPASQDNVVISDGFCKYIYCKNTTPQMTCFRSAKVCTKWLQDKVTIKSYSLTTSWNWEQVTS